MSKKKTIATTAFLVTLLILAFLVPHFLGIQAEACRRRRPHPHPHHSETLIKHFVYPDKTSIGECLEVTLWNDEQLYTQHTDATGTVTFAGIPDGTYTLSWSWQGVAMSEHVELRCTNIVWEFWNEVPYWTFEKTFYYDTVPPVPISHLTVTLNGYTGETDSDGYIAFTGLKAGTYTLEWVWGGVTHDEDVDIGFQTVSPVVLTNYLEPKSGGANKSTLG